MTLNPADFATKAIHEAAPSAVRKLFDLAATLNDPVSLGIGEPDFVTPMHIREAAWRSLQEGKTGYSSDLGILPLREAICSYLEKFDLHYDPASEIIINAGASQGLDLAFRTCLEPGDEVLLPEPTFLVYRSAIQLCGAVVESIPLSMETGFRVTPEMIENAITLKSKMLVLNFPSNPTGVVMSKEDLEAIAKVCIKHNLLVISDEIYAELNYTGNPHASIASLPGMKERTMLISGSSKCFAMTGWRIGYLCAPAELLKMLTKMQMFTVVCACTTSQWASLEGYLHGEADVIAMREEYDARRKFLVQAFRDMGLEICEPLGAFYAFPSIQSTGLTSQEFSDQLLADQEVITIPGTGFGAPGEGFIRCSYATSMENLEKAVERIDKFLKKIK